VFRAGRWQWLALAEAPQARRTRCPACLRARADEPAGVVTLVGAFVRMHGEELRRLIQHEEAVRRRRDPQSRIMWVRGMLDRIDVATTDIDLPRRIGEAVERAYGGTLDLVREANGSAIRVRWLGGGTPPVPGRGKAGEAGGRGACTSTRSQRTTTARWPSMARSMPRPSTG
jgi:hypothetical protein